jgi:hypothetical protein
MSDQDRLRTLALIDMYSKRGWRFIVRSQQEGYSCVVIGNGLASATGYGDTFEEAVDKAWNEVTRKIDDPAIMVAKHSALILAVVTDVLGPGAKYLLETSECYDEDALKLILKIDAEGREVQEMVDLEVKIWRELDARGDAELRSVLSIQEEWPHEA